MIGVHIFRGVLNRKSLGLERDYEHHGVDVPIRLIVLIRSNEFPFLDRVPPLRRRCDFTELSYQPLVLFYCFMHCVIVDVILLSYWFNKLDQLSKHRVQHLSP